MKRRDVAKVAYEMEQAGFDVQVFAYRDRSMTVGGTDKATGDYVLFSAVDQWEQHKAAAKH